MSEFVTPTRRDLSVDIVVGQCGQITLQIEQLLGNEMDDVTFPLNLL